MLAKSLYFNSVVAILGQNMALLVQNWGEKKVLTAIKLGAGGGVRP